MPNVTRTEHADRVVTRTVFEDGSVSTESLPIIKPKQYELVLHRTAGKDRRPAIFHTDHGTFAGFIDLTDLEPMPA